MDSICSGKEDMQLLGDIARCFHAFLCDNPESACAKTGKRHYDIPQQRWERNKSSYLDNGVVTRAEGNKEKQWKRYA